MTNFEEALEGIDFVPPIVDELYRLYYDNNGLPLFYSTEDLEGDYITVSKEDHNLGRYDVTVVNGCVLYPTEYIYQKLTPQSNGTACIDSDVSIIGNGTIWSLKRYE